MGRWINTAQFLYEHVGTPPEISVEQSFVHPMLLVKGDASNPAEFFSREQPFHYDRPCDVLTHALSPPYL